MTKSDLLNKLKDIQEIVEALPDHEPVETGIAISTVTEDKAAMLTGYSKSTLEGRRKAGKLKQFDVWWHDTEGRVIYDLNKLQDAMRCHHQREENTQEYKSEAKPSESVSHGKAGRSNGKRTPHLLHLQG